MNRSAHSSDLWGLIDYTGIIILILGDFVSAIYVGFYCEPILQNTYWTMVCSDFINPASDLIRSLRGLVADHDISG